MNRSCAHMLADHVHPQVFQEAQIKLHGLESWREINPIWPVSLIERAKLKDKLTVQKRTLDTIDTSRRHRPESSIAGN